MLSIWEDSWGEILKGFFEDNISTVQMYILSQVTMYLMSPSNIKDEITHSRNCWVI